MPFTTYGALKSAIADRLARTDLTSAIVDFVDLGRVRVQNDLKLHGFNKTATGTLAVADKLALPADAMEVRHLELFVQGENVTLQRVDPTTFTALRTNGSAGTPMGYMIHDADVLFAPDATVGIAYTLRYFGTVGAIPADGSTDDVLSHYPMLLFYASLVESAPHLKDDARVQTWLGLYERDLAQARKIEWNLRAGMSDLRIRPDRMSPHASRDIRS